MLMLWLVAVLYCCLVALQLYDENACVVYCGACGCVVSLFDVQLYDEDTNPYLAHITGVLGWGPASLAGQHVLVVDRADNTRTTLATFIAKVRETHTHTHAHARICVPGDEPTDAKGRRSLASAQQRVHSGALL